MMVGLWGPDLLVGSALLAIGWANRKAVWSWIVLIMALICSMSGAAKALQDPLFLIGLGLVTVVLLYIQCRKHNKKDSDK